MSRSTPCYLLTVLTANTNHAGFFSVPCLAEDVKFRAKPRPIDYVIIAYSTKYDKL